MTFFIRNVKIYSDFPRLGIFDVRCQKVVKKKSANDLINTKCVCISIQIYSNNEYANLFLCKLYNNSISSLVYLYFHRVCNIQYPIAYNLVSLYNVHVTIKMFFERHNRDEKKDEHFSCLFVVPNIRNTITLFLLRNVLNWVARVAINSAKGLLSLLQSFHITFFRSETSDIPGCFKINEKFWC